jgi:hypothetical protein
MRVDAQDGISESNPGQNIYRLIDRAVYPSHLCESGNMTDRRALSSAMPRCVQTERH